MMDVLALALAYLLGSIPFGLLLSRLFGLGDIRNIGSGNIGATNVLRSGNKKAAALTLLFDALKGVAAVLITAQIAPDQIYAAALLAVIGHNFPVWLTFKGGKGVATSLGVLLALHGLIGLAIAATWLGIFLITRISSMAALIAAISAPVWAWFITQNVALAITAGILSTLLIVRHIPNIKRLLSGSESKSM